MSEPVVSRLILQGFRSLPAAAVEFSNPTFLVGRNGSGKSNLADALAFLAEAMVSPLGTVLDRRGGLAVIRNRGPARGDRSDFGLGVVLGPLGGDTVGGRYAFAVRELPGAGFEVGREQCTVRMRGGEDRWFDRNGGEFSSNVGGLAPVLEPSALGLPVIGGRPPLGCHPFRAFFAETAARGRDSRPGSPGTTFRRAFPPTIAAPPPPGGKWTSR